MDSRKLIMLFVDGFLVLFLLKAVALDFGYGTPYKPEDIARLATIGFAISGYCVFHMIYERNKQSEE